MTTYGRHPAVALVLLVGLGSSCCKRAGNAGSTSTRGEESNIAAHGVSRGSPAAEQPPAVTPRPPEALPEHALRSPTNRSPMQTKGLEKLIRRIRRQETTYRAPSPDERRAYRGWVERVSATVAGEDAPETLPALPGFRITSLPEGAPAVWVLHEAPGAERGAGVIVVRRGVALPLVVQAPHTFFDSHTLDIALSAFDALRARALLVNTIHRAGRSGAAPSHDTPSEEDAAHNPRSFFAAAHEGLSGVLERHVAVQLHGFRDSQAPGVDAIVSAAGTSARVDGLLSALRAFAPAGVVHHYPSQIRKLGGTTNVQARWSARHDLPFVHLELSHRLRSQLEADDQLRWRFVQRLEAALESNVP